MGQIGYIKLFDSLVWRLELWLSWLWCCGCHDCGVVWLYVGLQQSYWYCLPSGPILVC